MVLITLRAEFLSFSMILVIRHEETDKQHRLRLVVSTYFKKSYDFYAPY